MAMPSKVLVPRPTSSSTTRLRAVARAHDRRRFDHLDHERAPPGGDVVVGADAGEDAIDDADMRRLGRHEAADLGHQHDQRHLAQVGALAGHVRAGQQHDPRVGPERGVVGHELARRQAVLDDRVAAFDDLQRVGRRRRSGACSRARRRSRPARPADRATAIARAVSASRVAALGQAFEQRVVQLALELNARRRGRARRAPPSLSARA